MSTSLLLSSVPPHVCKGHVCAVNVLAVKSSVCRGAVEKQRWDSGSYGSYCSASRCCCCCCCRSRIFLSSCRCLLYKIKRRIMLHYKTMDMETHSHSTTATTTRPGWTLSWISMQLILRWVIVTGVHSHGGQFNLLSASIAVASCDTNSLHYFILWFFKPLFLP